MKRRLLIFISDSPVALQAILFSLVLLFAGPRNLLSLDKPDHPMPRRGFDFTGLVAGSSIEQAVKGSVDFVVGDLPMTRAEVDQVMAARGIRMLNLPTAIEATVPCYNVPGVKSGLRFSPEALAGVFLGEITKWNDPAIKASNPGIALPSSSFVLVQRTDENGSTYAWTDYLSKVSPTWKVAIGPTRTVALRVPLSTEGPDSIARLVKETPNSLSFLELWAAKKAGLQVGLVRNHNGFFVEATAASMRAAVDSELTSLSTDVRESITNAPGEGAYPICGFMWIIVPETIPNPEKRQKIVSFLKWVLTEGQGTPDTLFYGALPKSLVRNELRIVDGIR